MISHARIMCWLLILYSKSAKKKRLTHRSTWAYRRGKNGLGFKLLYRHFKLLLEKNVQQFFLFFIKKMFFKYAKFQAATKRGHFIKVSMQKWRISELSIFFEVSFFRTTESINFSQVFRLFDFLFNRFAPFFIYSFTMWLDFLSCVCVCRSFLQFISNAPHFQCILHIRVCLCFCVLHVTLAMQFMYKFRPHCEMHLISVLVDRASFGINDQTVWMCSIKFDITFAQLFFFWCVLFCWTRTHQPSGASEPTKSSKIKLRWLGCIYNR